MDALPGTSFPDLPQARRAHAWRPQADDGMRRFKHGALRLARNFPATIEAVLQIESNPSATVATFARDCHQFQLTLFFHLNRVAIQKIFMHYFDARRQERRNR